MGGGAGGRPVSARMRNPDRVAAKRFADDHGYFWLPCPRCGEHFGGHEWHAGPSVQCADPDTGHGACCPKVSDEQDAHACRRVHEMRGESVPSRSADHVR